MVVSHYRSHGPVHAIDIVIRRMSSLAPLAEHETALLRSLSSEGVVHAANALIIEPGAPAGTARFIVSGWACHHRILPDGRRQVFYFLLPGDPVGFSQPPDAPQLASVTALTELETVDAESVRQAVQDPSAYPGLSRALQLAARAVEARLLDQLVRLGRQTAYERVAHLLLELHDRQTAVQLTDGGRFLLPLTQEVLADALGLSIVHVNRTLQQLRRERLIDLKGGEGRLLAPPVLAALSNYRPSTG